MNAEFLIELQKKVEEAEKIHEEFRQHITEHMKMNALNNEIKQLREENEKLKAENKVLSFKLSLKDAVINGLCNGNEQLKAQLQQFESKPANENKRAYKCDTCKDNGVIVLGANANIFPCPHGCQIKFTPLPLPCIERWKTDMLWGVKQKDQTFEEWTKENECRCKCRTNSVERKPIPSRLHEMDRPANYVFADASGFSKPRVCPQCDGAGGKTGLALDECFLCKGEGVLWEPIK